MHRLLKSKNLIVALAFWVTIALTATAGHAQIVGELEANIPFAFYAANTRMPAGQYYIREVTDLGDVVLQIESANKNIAAMVVPEYNQQIPVPKESGLTFDKAGDQFFLSDITVQDSAIGYHLLQPRAEKKLIKNNVKVEKHKLTVTHHKTRVSKP